MSLSWLTVDTSIRKHLKEAITRGGDVVEHGLAARFGISGTEGLHDRIVLGYDYFRDAASGFRANA
jgi:hypothetical protein